MAGSASGGAVFNTQLLTVGIVTHYSRWSASISDMSDRPATDIYGISTTYLVLASQPYTLYRDISVMRLYK